MKKVSDNVISAILNIFFVIVVVTIIFVGSSTKQVRQAEGIESNMAVIDIHEVPLPTPTPFLTPQKLASKDPRVISIPNPEPTPEGQAEDEEVPSSFEEEEAARVPTWQDVASYDDVVRIAKTVSAEAGGIWNQIEQKSVIWCILNRCDSWGSSISSVCVAGQFAYYSSNSTYDGYGRDMITLTEEVLTEWAKERAGMSCNRTLPRGYLYFYGDGSHNYFSTSYPVRGGILYS